MTFGYLTLLLMMMITIFTVSGLPVGRSVQIGIDDHEAAAETSLVEDQARLSPSEWAQIPCPDGRKANGDGSCTEAGMDRPFCVRARASRFGGSNDEMCKKKGMRRACPESCMGHGAAAETNLVEDKAPCADGRKANGDGSCTEAGMDRPFCVRARAPIPTLARTLQRRLRLRIQPQHLPQLQRRPQPKTLLYLWDMLFTHTRRTHGVPLRLSTLAAVEVPTYRLSMFTVDGS